MKLQDLLRQDEESLFKDFISIPTITHVFDRRRFLKYALVSNANRSGFNRERVRILRQKGFKEREIDEMRKVYEWVEDLLEVLN